VKKKRVTTLEKEGAAAGYVFVLLCPIRLCGEEREKKKKKKSHPGGRMDHLSFLSFSSSHPWRGLKRGKKGGGSLEVGKGLIKMSSLCRLKRSVAGGRGGGKTCQAEGGGEVRE